MNIVYLTVTLHNATLKARIPVVTISCTENVVAQKTIVSARTAPTTNRSTLTGENQVELRGGDMMVSVTDHLLRFFLMDR